MNEKLYWDKRLLELPIIKQWYLESVEKEFVRKVIADEKHKISTKKWRKENRVKYSQAKKQWNKQNREKNKTWNDRWRKRNPEKVKAMDKKHYETHREHIWVETIQTKL